MSRPEGTSVSDHAAALVLIFMAPLFFFVLVFGWHRLWLNSLPLGGNFLAWPFAVLLAASAVVLAKAVAAERVKLKDPALKTKAGQEKRAKDQTWMAYLLLLFSISAFGTLSAAVYYGEGSKLIQENVDAATQCVDRLESVASTWLLTPQFDAKKAKVGALQVALVTEIKNARNCGDGPKAIGILRKLQIELPALERPSGRSASCEEMGPLVAQYEQMIGEQIRQSPEYLADHVAEKQLLRTQIADFIDKSRATLRTTGANLRSAAFGLDTARSSLEDMLKDLNTYTARGRSFSKDAPELQCTVNMEDARALGVFSQTLPLLAGRRDRVSTYVYVMAAFTMDLLMIVIFARVIRGARGRPERGRGPASLWSPIH